MAKAPSAAGRALQELGDQAVLALQHEAGDLFIGSRPFPADRHGS